MALIKCHECGKKVSTEATVCPACGAAVKIPEPKQVGASRNRIVKWVLVIVALYALGGIIKAVMEASKSPEELKQDAESNQAAQLKKAEHDKQAVISMRRAKIAAIAAQTIQQAARNPASVIWEGILANDDASVVCIEMRAQNGFGGMNIESMAVINGEIKTSDTAWNKNCANKTLFDVKSEVINLLKIAN